MAKTYFDVVDASDREWKRAAHFQVDQATGFHEWRLAKWFPGRTNRQNKYWHIAFVQPFHYWLLESQGAEDDEFVGIDHFDAHDFLVRQILPVKTVPVGNDGHFIEKRAQTHTMSTKQFSVMCELATEWLRETCDLEIVSADEFWRRWRAGELGD